MQQTLPDTILTRLSDLFASRMGLHFPVERWADLERGVTAVASDLGASDTLSCARRLLSMRLTHREIGLLAGQLTVGETYFFRERQGLEAFERHILPELMRARETSGRRLRIWSAGCCSGEEPYSIAMLLDRMIMDAASWNTTLLATDINGEFLRKAMRGEYGEWSFRGMPEWARDRYFRRGQNGRYELDERIRRRVQFSCLNLADDAYPSLTSNTNAMDVIFCRNVLMYFTAAQAKSIIEKFHRTLADGGWLIVSPVETSIALFSRFTAVEVDGAILYRKQENAGVPRRPVSNSVREENPWPDGVQIAVKPDSWLETQPQESPQSVKPPDELQPASGVPEDARHVPAIRVARDYANLGRLDEAVEWCRVAITEDKLNPGHQYLLATILQEQGLVDAAAQSLLRALYLAPDFVLAHFALGNLRCTQGRYSEARRHFENALSLLGAHSPDEVLPESEGLTAGRLGEIIDALLPSLPEIARNMEMEPAE